MNNAPELLASSVVVAERQVPAWQRLLFVVHRDGHIELDLGWMILLVVLNNGIAVWDLVALNPDRFHVSVAAWSWYGALISMAFIAGVVRDRARMLAKSPMPGQVADGIAHVIELDRDAGRNPGEERA